MTDTNERFAAAVRTETLMTDRLRQGPREIAPGIWLLENGCHAFTLAAMRRVAADYCLFITGAFDQMEQFECYLLAAALDAEGVPR